MESFKWIEAILNDRRVIIYGAGDYGTTIIKYLKINKLLEIKVLAIAVTKLEKDLSIEGILVQEIGSLLKYKNEPIVLAVSEEKRAEVVFLLEAYGFTEFITISEAMIRIMKHNIELYDKEEFVRKEISVSKKYIDEVLVGMNFDRLIAESVWLTKKDFTVGGAAVSYKYLYLLYKILDSNKFHSLLDIGMGQTSKMMSQYVNYNSKASHIIIEDNEDWINFITPSLSLGDNSKIIRLQYEMKEYEDEMVRVYDGFYDMLKNYKFDYISVDAPIGIDMKKYSRIDVLDIIPECLDSSWIIMLDDVQREGELNTLSMVRDKLNKNGIMHVVHMFNGGEKKFAILASIDNQFFCTV